MTARLTVALAVMFLSLVPYSVQASERTSEEWRGGPIFDGLRGALQQAAIVARVRLVSRVLVGTRPSPDGTWQPVLGEEPSCGYLYTAEVVEGFKGDPQTFEFFSANEEDFSGLNQEYFVVVFQRKRDHRLLDLDDTKLTFGEEEGREINCLISQKYYVGRLVQSMFAFDELAPSQLGGEWLAPPNREAVGWCFYQKPIAGNGEPRVFYDKKVVAGGGSYGLQSWKRYRKYMGALLASGFTSTRSYPVRNWSDFKRIILQNLGGGPYLAC